LSVAIVYDWNPAGTKAPEEKWALSSGWSPAESDAPAEEKLPDWDGRYFPECLQEITEDDARALADALERALPDIPKEDLPVGDSLYDDPEGEGWRVDITPPAAKPNPLQELSGKNRTGLKDLVIHLREPGGFLIGP